MIDIIISVLNIIIYELIYLLGIINEHSNIYLFEMNDVLFEDHFKSCSCVAHLISIRAASLKDAQFSKLDPN